MVSLIIILCVIALAMYLVWRFIPQQPIQIIFLIVLGIALIIVVFRVAGISLPE